MHADIVRESVDFLPPGTMVFVALNGMGPVGTNKIRSAINCWTLATSGRRAKGT